LDARSLVGGGRIVGEACHFIDLSVALIKHRLVSIHCTRRDTDGQDGGCFELNFADGSTSIIDYRTDLPPEVPKENIEISGQTWSAHIHNWARLTSTGLGVSLNWPWSRTPHKGHPQALQKFISASEGKSPAPIPLDQIIEVSKAAIHMQNLTEGSNINL
jgi:predicted dehydrogenase